PLAPSGLLTNGTNGFGFAKANCFLTASEARGPSIYVGGDFDYADSVTIPSHGIARYGPPKPVLALYQATPAGSPVYVRVGGLLPGHEYINLFSQESCGGALGTGPWFGLCANDLWLLIAEYFSPIGTFPFHFMATATSA